MLYSVIIGDTEGRAKSLSRSSGSVFKQKGERGTRFGMCTKLREGIRAPRGGARVSCACVFVNAGISRAPSIPGYAPTEKDIIGEEHDVQDSNLQGNAERV